VRHGSAVEPTCILFDVALTRRDFLTTLGTACAIRSVERLLAAQNLVVPPDGRLIGTVPLGRFDGRPAPPMGTLLGTGLDARQFTDTSTLTGKTLITATQKFFIRTAATAANSKPGRWTIGLSGRVRRPAELSPDDLRPLAQSMGTHLMECSGNVDPANFGLMSAARWTGVPVAAGLDRIEPMAGASLVRVTGLDDESRSWQSSVAGASWIFSRSDLEKAGAFLATGMNDAALTPDHGAPVRLVVPNWFGCVSIKWVTNVDLIADDEPPTTQMREFAARTHQEGTPTLARDFQPTAIELAAMPIRVEKWSVEGRTIYRVIGVQWGGSTPTRSLTIRFKHTEAFVPVEDCPAPASTTTWSLWSHTWRPAQPGRYQIALGVGDRNVPAQRLDMFYYTREVEIDQV
jgi:DMSO/TMAO reductase YedYZ molybdopterin-dependent catalytic subunit